MAVGVSHITVHKYEHATARMFQRRSDFSHTMTNGGQNMQRKLNGMVRAHALIAADPLVHHSTCHSRAIKNPGERKHAISATPGCSRSRFSSFCLLSVSLTHSVSSALSAGNQFPQCPTLALELMLLSTCMIKEATRQSAAFQATSDSGGNQCGYLKGQRPNCLTQLGVSGSKVASFGFYVTKTARLPTVELTPLGF